MINYLLISTLKKVILLIFVAGGVLLLASGPAMAGPPDLSVCDNFSGKAKGLCQAGIAVGCADGTGNANACGNIEQLLADAGVTPPWLDTGCPCHYASLLAPTIPPWEPLSASTKVLSCNPGVFAGMIDSFGIVSGDVDNQITVGSPVAAQCYTESISSAISREDNKVSGLNQTQIDACIADIVAYAHALEAANPGNVVLDGFWGCPLY